MTKTNPQSNPQSNHQTNRSSRRSRAGVIATLGAAALLMIPAVALAQPGPPAAPSNPGWQKGPRAKAGYGRHWKRGKRGKRGMRGMRGMRGGPLMKAPIAKLQKQLNLTPAQVQQIKALRRSNAKVKMMRLRKQARRIRAKMHAEMLEDKPNLLKLAVLHKRMQKTKNRMSNQRFKMRIAVFKILSPDQRMKLKQMRHRRFGKRHGRFGKRHGRFGKRGRRHHRGFHGGW